MQHKLLHVFSKKKSSTSAFSFSQPSPSDGNFVPLRVRAVSDHTPKSQYEMQVTRGEIMYCFEETKQWYWGQKITSGFFPKQAVERYEGKPSEKDRAPKEMRRTKSKSTYLLEEFEPVRQRNNEQDPSNRTKEANRRVAPDSSKKSFIIQELEKIHYEKEREKEEPTLKETQEEKNFEEELGKLKRKYEMDLRELEEKRIQELAAFQMQCAAETEERLRAFEEETKAPSFLIQNLQNFTNQLEKHENELLVEMKSCLEEAKASIEDTIKKRNEEWKTCCICYADQKDMVINCGHTFCSTCVGRMTQCPICKVQISRKIKFFL